MIENGNANAIYLHASDYAEGTNGMPRDMSKAAELWLKAGELGCAEAYCNVGNAYDNGRGVEVDKKKAKHLYELGAMMGNVIARYNLGLLEGKVGNHERAKKHMIIAARAGDPSSLDKVKAGYMNGLVTKDEYANTLRSYQKRTEEMKSDTRDQATAFYELPSR